MQRANSANPAILITGASDGIGLALAKRYHALGARLILIGRRPADMIDPLLTTHHHYCQVDLTSNEAITTLTQFLADRSISRIDLLILNAGVGSYGPIDAQSAESIDLLLNTNLLAPMALTHALLPMLPRPHGQVVLIGSVAADLPAPEYAVYAASKAALAGFARSLRIELAGQVRVQVVHPGAVRTGMHAKIGMPLEQIGWQRFPPAEQIADQIVRAIASHKPVVTLGWGNRLLRWFSRFAGTMIDRAVQQRQQVPAGIVATSRSERPTLRHVVITGGADGIGRAVAAQYAQSGAQITIIDRDRERAQAACAQLGAGGQPITAIIADLGDLAEIARCIDALQCLPPIDLIVYSAGISAVGTFAESNFDRQRAVVDLNLRAPLLLSAGLLQRQQIAPGGVFVFLASLSIFTAYPGASGYAASKAGIAAYARSLRVAMAKRGMHALVVAPGPTRTAHARRYSPDNRREGARMPPEQVARQIAAAVATRQRLLIPGIGNRWMAWVGTYLPGLAEWLMRKIIFERLRSH